MISLIVSLPTAWWFIPAAVLFAALLGVVAGTFLHWVNIRRITSTRETTRGLADQPYRRAARQTPHLDRAA